jgi:hypothetical protein
VLVLGLLAAGAALAWGLSTLGDDPGSATVVVTRTAQGRTVEQTVTQQSTVTQTVETQSGNANSGNDNRGNDGNDQGTPPSGGVALNDRGFRLLQQGDPQAALPLLESAVSSLSGSNSIEEAYAAYNLAWARFALGRCDGVPDLLDRSEAIQGKRKEIDRLRKQVDKACRD